MNDAPKLHSIQVGKVVIEGEIGAKTIGQRRWKSAFDKRPVEGVINVQALGVEGDEVGTPSVHGGVDKAILCYAQSNYVFWRKECPDLGLDSGGFGENFSIASLDETTVCIGDRFRIGDKLLVEVSQPREPCWKIARRWNCEELPKRVGETGKTGWYVRVQEPGSVQAGDSIELADRPHPDWPISRINDILMGRLSDRVATIELMNLAVLADAFKRSIS
ncbi:MAG: MOSC domain-containing protein [Planctomycetota bacterium]